MKKILLTLILIIINSQIIAQTDDCPICPPNGSDQTEYDVIKTKDMMYEGEYVPGEILIKYKDEVTLVLGKSSKGTVITGISAIDAVFEKHKITEAKKLFPQEDRLQQKQILKSFNGYEFERPSLHNIHKIKICEEAERVNIFEAIEELKQIPEVEYAEPNYIYSIIDSEPLSPELSEEEMLEWINKQGGGEGEKGRINKIQAVVPNDPLYSEQWGIPATQVDLVWETTTGDTTQVIAILDTGVDWNHPDLKNKIWKNIDEIEGNGQDNDGNGFIDDIRGWDFINHDNNPMDDNSHGTHVAGIAAAEGNNGIGIAGVNWGAKIMPIKVFQSSGRGDAATITEGIIYATNKGATVINMSFGSYTRSLTMEDALANAYATSVLVAAAGNDDKCIGPPEVMKCKRFYPAAISYVLGVEATKEIASPCSPGQPSTFRACFSNYDQDGPVFSRYEELNNYEIKAPGANIISSVPNGNYRVYNGTSMSVPLVAGAVSLYSSVYTSQSQELMWGNFINTINIHIQVFNAMNIDADPRLWFVSHTIVDTLDGDGDGRVDAGETIELWFEVRNTWGQVDSVWVGIEFGEFEDTTTATILKENAFIGSISTYAKRSNEFNPLKIAVESSLANARDITFRASLWYPGLTEPVFHNMILVAENGEEISGVIDSILVLTPNKLWLVRNSLRIGNNGKLIIKPGAKILIDGSQTIDLRGNISARGTKDSLIIISSYPFTGFSSGFYRNNRPTIGDTLEFVHFRNLNKVYIQDLANWPGLTVKNCIFENIYGGTAGVSDFLRGFRYLINNVFLFCHGQIVAEPIGSISLALFNNFIGGYYRQSNSNNRPEFKYNNFVNIKTYNDFSTFFEISSDDGSYSYNNFISSKIMNTVGSADILHVPYNYWGTLNEDKINDFYIDFWDGSNLPLLDITPYLTMPSDSAHGIVWKVLVDGVDSQDEHLDPIGPGPHRFDVYFNRAMDTDYTPSLSFGVREPFNQQAVTDSSFWSADSMIWTAYKTIQLHTGDGINRIRVADARDTEDFEIPIEDQRFEFVIDAAGLSSVDFNATAGLGKIELDWIQPEDVVDLLGYNLYRFTNLTDTTYTDTLMVNTEMILDTTYVDYDVIPGNNYYYQYTVVKTDFTESDRSIVVGSTALTSSPGDANGDLAVTVQDIVSIVAYLLNQNPQPFILEAADVNGDSQVNILDIVATVNIIMSESLPKLSEISGTPKITFDKKSAYIEEGEGLAGLQFKIVGTDIAKANLITGEAAKGMEISYNVVGDTMYVVMFSFKNQTLTNKEKGMLFSLTEGYLRELKEVTGSNQKGDKVEIGLVNDGEIIPKDFTLYQNYPNPFNPTTTIRYAIPKQEKVEIRIYNILGQKVWEYLTEEQQPGYYEVKWNSVNSSNRQVATGVYIYQIRAGKFIQAKKMLLLK
ncbi:MAG: S8 family serine peptidase [Melioribacteraceae bacterium]|nr:MAG: S8 family serine peptidase [Melioribacteraceae bacterium]